MKKFTDIILHIPHSSGRIEEDDLAKWSGDIEICIRRLTDWHTDKLFASELDGVHAMVFDYNRFYCDVERLVNDPMEEIGQGIAYCRFGDCVRALSDGEIREIYDLCFAWHARFAELCKGCGKPLIIDCHSFPKDMAENVDICVGFNDDWSNPGDELLTLIFDLFVNAGYRVAFNRPYSNSMVPQGNGVQNCRSIMIEVNKSVYLDADGYTISAGLHRINALLNQLYKIILQ